MKSRNFPLLLLLILTYFSSQIAAYFYLEEATFQEVENDHESKFVIFYRSSNPEHLRTLDLVEEVAEQTIQDYPHFYYKICDGDNEANKNNFSSAGFGENLFVFTNFVEQGIQKFNPSITVENLTQHVKDLHATYNEKDIQDFSTETDFLRDLKSDARPIFVKFYENWCTHCKALRKPYNILGTSAKSYARFYQVECSKNADTQQFCAKYEAKSFPTLRLFTQDKSYLYDKQSRSVIEMRSFLSDYATASFIELSPSSVAANINAPKASADHELVELKEKIEHLESIVEVLIDRIEKLEASLA